MTAGILDYKNGIKRRLTQIAKYKYVSLWWTLPALILLFFIGIISLTGAQNVVKDTKELESNNLQQQKKEYPNQEKSPISEIKITMGADGIIKLSGKELKVDSLSEELNMYQFDKNSIIALAPEQGCSWNTWMEVQLQLQKVNVNKIKYINTETGKYVITRKYKLNFIAQDSIGLSPVQLNGKYGFKRGYIGGKGEIVIEPRFEDAKLFNEGLAPIKIDGKWGYINPRGEIIIEPRFDVAFSFKNGTAMATIFENPELNIKGQGLSIDKAENLLKSRR